MRELKAVYKLLKDDATFSNLVTASGKTRIFPLRVPQTVLYPATVIFRVSEVPTRCSQGTTAMDRHLFQVSHFAERYEQIDAMDEAARAALVNQSGLIQGVNILTIDFVTARDLYQDDAEIYHRATDFYVYSQPVQQEEE